MADVQIFTRRESSNKTLLNSKMKPTIPEEFFILQKQEHRVMELRHEMNLLQRDETAHMQALKNIQQDKKQLQLQLREREIEYEQCRLQMSHYYQSKKDDTKKEKYEDDNEKEPARPRKSSVIHYPDTESYYEHQRKHSASSPTIIPSPSDITSPSHMISTSPYGYSSKSSSPSMFPLMSRSKGPPMKTCLSCKHSIHRNAPVCPICKAKSHSKNPKKRKTSE